MFRASDHTYYVDGRRTKGSVTGMIHAFCAPFDAGMVITRMMRGSNWPRAGYLKSDVSFTWMSRLGVLCPGVCTLAAQEMTSESANFYGIFLRVKTSQMSLSNLHYLAMKSRRCGQPVAERQRTMARTCITFSRPPQRLFGGEHFSRG